MSDINSVAQVIQQAVAPVFLLSGVSGLLAVMTNRLARIVDYSRTLLTLDREDNAGKYAAEIRHLSKRAKWTHRAVSLCTVCALLICVVVATLFIGSELDVTPGRLIATLFTAAMGTLIAGLLCFLKEIALATQYLESPRFRGEEN